MQGLIKCFRWMRDWEELEASDRTGSMWTSALALQSSTSTSNRLFDLSHLPVLTITERVELEIVMEDSTPFEKKLFASLDQFHGLLAEANSMNRSISLHRSPHESLICTFCSTSPASLSYWAVQQLESKLVVGQCALRTATNMRQPVNRLPPEVLAIIFCQMICLPAEDHYDAVYLMLTAALVCRYWWEVALSHPALWSYIVLDDHIDLIQLQLSRSGSAPLSLVIYDVGGGVTPWLN